MHAKSIALLAALTLSLACQAAEPTESYPIDYERVSAVGERFGLAIKWKQVTSRVVRVKDKITENEHGGYSFEFAAQAEVTAVSASKQPEIMKYTVTKFIQLYDDGLAPLDLLPPGSKLTQDTSNGKNAFVLEGGELAPEILRTLEIIVTHDVHSGLQTSVYGTTAKKKVGEKWPAVAKAAAADMTEQGQQVDEKDITGSTTLLDVVKINGFECLKLQSHLQVKNIKPKNQWPDMTFKSVELTIRQDVALPLDTSKSWMQFTSRIEQKAALEGKTPQGEATTMEIQSVFTGDTQREYSAAGERK